MTTKHSAPIILAAFGTSEPTAVDAILAVRRRVEAAFPESAVSLAFTSNTIRNIWRARANDAVFRRDHPAVPEELYSVTNVLSALAAVQEQGFRPVLVQSLHVTDGEEFHDLRNLAQLLTGYEPANASRKPFPMIALGEPALGIGDGEPAPLRRAAEALRPLADRAKAEDAALVLMAHGNERLNQSVFKKFEHALRAHYGPYIYIGTVEAPPLAADVVHAVKTTPGAPAKVLLAPLMLVAGEHALRDMSGDDEAGWKTLFQKSGFSVQCHLEGLGHNPSWADIHVEHLRAAERRLYGRL
jgi:sirohydrochlorin cobaltochelatase